MRRSRRRTFRTVLRRIYITLVVLNAPVDAPITTAGAAIHLNDGSTWLTLYNATARGTNGETITSLGSNLTSGNFQQHRLAIQGNGAGPIYCAQLQLRP
jgi:hypothetical protein